MPQPRAAGNIQKHASFPSRVLMNRRDIYVYLPPGYRRGLRQRYPVLYLNDGQNIFYSDTAFNNVPWRVGETAQKLIRQKLVEPLIIVAVANTGEHRINEYAPTRGLIDAKAKRKKRSRGLARKYGKFLTEELKPFIDSTYRTRSDPDSTGLGGSSLGGLVTMAVGLWFSNIFRRLAVMSPSVWWDNEAILQMVDQVEEKLPLRIWLDTGTNEPGWQRAMALRDKLIEKGWRLDDDLVYWQAEGADHSEAAWGARVDPMLRFLFPPIAPTSHALTTTELATMR